MLFGIVQALNLVPLETNLPSHVHENFQYSGNENMPVLTLDGGTP
jgi:hypothetical protein